MRYENYFKLLGDWAVSYLSQQILNSSFTANFPPAYITYGTVRGAFIKQFSLLKAPNNTQWIVILQAYLEVKFFVDEFVWRKFRTHPAIQ